MKNPFKKKVDLTPSIRREKESFAAYRKRRAKRNQLLKDKLKPKVKWDTSKLGTYERNKKK